MCGKTSEEKKLKMSERRKTLIQQGLCPNCGNPNTSGKYYCYKCNNIHYARTIQKRLEKFIDKKCYICGNPLSNTNNNLCENCLKQKIAKNNQNRLNKKEQGFCTRCGQKSDIVGSWHCSKCREIVNEKRRKKQNMEIKHE